MLRLPEFTCELDSTSNRDVKDNSRAHLRFSLPAAVRLTDRAHYVSITHMKMPLTIYNISAAKGNNLISYTVDNGTTWNDITFGDGVYSLEDISSTIRYTLGKNAHFNTDAVTGAIHYPFTFAANGATSHAYVTIDKTYKYTDEKKAEHDYKETTLDLTGCSLVLGAEVRGTSTFYLTLGFIAANTILDGNVAVEFIGTNNVDLADNQYSIECNLVSRYYRGSLSPKIITSTFEGLANGYYFLPNATIRDVTAEFRSGLRQIDEVDIKIVDRYGNLVNFGDNSTDSDVYINLCVY